MTAFFHSFPLCRTWIIPSLVVESLPSQLNNLWKNPMLNLRNTCMCLISDICGSYSGEYGDCYLLGATLSSQVQVSFAFHMNMLPPSSGSKSKPSTQQANTVLAAWLLLAWLIPRPWGWRKYVFTKPVNFYWTTRRHIPAHGTLHSRNCCIWNGTEECKQNKILTCLVLRKNI
jgi:hypothetical protein